MYASIAFTLAGLSLSVYHQRDARHLSLRYGSGESIEGQTNTGEVAGNCRKVEGGSFDCTSLGVRQSIYEAAKKGITWYTKPETKEEKLKAVCDAQGIYNEDCPKILKAMSMQESGFGKWMVGDQGRSHGYFHILNIHKDVTLECASSLTCSATWTLKRMVRNGYKQDKWKGVASHNSYTPSVGAAYAKAVKKQLAKL